MSGAPGRGAHRRQVEGALSALAFHGDGGYSWFGERFPAGEAGTLIRRIAWRLYLDFYTQGGATPTLDRRFTPSGRGRADLVPRLTAVNGGRGSQEPGWRVSAATADALVIERIGLTLHVPAGSVRDAGGRTPGAGEEGSLELPNELRSRSPGHYMALGDLGMPADEPRGRLYWNLTPEGAVAAMAHLTQVLNEARIPFSFKVLSDSSAYTRRDAGVLYAPRERIAAIVALAEEVAEALPWALRDGVPALTLPIAPGIGYADDPDDGESFGLHRCRLIAEAIVDSRHGGSSSGATMVAVEERFAAAGLSLDAPYRSPTRPAALIERERPPRRPAARQMDPVEASLDIGRRVLDSALWHGDRCSWIAPALETRPGGAPRPVVRPIGASLHRGTAGVGLFLAELHAATGEAGLRDTALAALRTALTAPGEGSGLYVGRVGVAYAAVRCADLLEADELRGRARALLRGRPVDTEVDLHSGLAGSAVGLLALAPGLGSGVRDALDPLGDAIVARAEGDAETMSWPTGPDGARLANLLGMAHGASGIGLALAMLGAESGDGGLADAARAAFRYERGHADPEHGWPDLRARGRTGAPGPSFTTAWCHGAPGVALARMRAWALLGDAELREEADAGLAITAAAVRGAAEGDGADFCLCHGLAGNADILLEGARTLPGAPPAWQRLARSAAESGIARYPARSLAWPCGPAGETPGLMLGLAGIGLFLLRLSDPTVPSVLAIGGLASDRPITAAPTLMEVTHGD